jgi:hypothetical protein
VARRSPILALLAALAGALVLVSGGSSADPRTPPPLPGLPPPFLGTAVAGGGGLTAAIDSYGDVADLRWPGPAGEALIDNSSARQVAGTVPVSTGIVIRAGGGPDPRPLWRAKRVRQSYLPGTNVVVTQALVAGARLRVLDAATGNTLVRRIVVRAGLGEARLSLSVNADAGLRCRPATSRGRALTWQAPHVLRATLRCSVGGPPAVAGIAATARADRAWLARASPLGSGAPGWARAMYRRSLLVLRALTDARTGAVAAGARDGWAYVWPRDAATAVLALKRSGYAGAARRAAAFLRSLDLDAGARFRGDRSAVADERELPGDAGGWVGLATTATGLPPAQDAGHEWRDRGDYGERDGERADLLANAVAAGVPAGAIRRQFSTGRGLSREAGDATSGADSAAAWAVRPFPRPSLYPSVSETLRPLLRADRGLGIQPVAGWPGPDPWTAPTAWSAWSLAALRDRGAALRLLGDLRSDATAAGTLPERVDARSGVPVSTTPLAWSHAFAILALHELWPGR